jgi:hypothetical protein
MQNKYVYTNNLEKYQNYLLNIPIMNNPSYLDQLIKDFNLLEVIDLSTLFGIQTRSH